MLKELLQEAHNLTPATKWPTYDGKLLDRTEFLTSSEVAGCLRQSFFNKQPGKAVWKGNGYTERGHAVEAWIVEKLAHLEQLGYHFEYVGENQRSFYDADIGISGTPDGLMYTPNGLIYLLEFKSVDPRKNMNNLPEKKHVYQIHQNMFLVQKCLDVTLEGAILFYIEASNFFNTYEYFYQADPKMIEICKFRAEKLWKAKEADDLDPEGLHSGECEPCHFTSECSATIQMEKALAAAGAAGVNFSVSELPAVVVVTAEEKKRLADFLDEREEVKNLTKDFEETAKYVKEFVDKRGGLVVVDDRIITVTPMAGRETIDKKLMLKDGLDLDKYSKVGAPFLVMNVKEPK